MDRLKNAAGVINSLFRFFSGNVLSSSVIASEAKFVQEGIGFAQIRRPVSRFYQVSMHRRFHRGMPGKSLTSKRKPGRDSIESGVVSSGGAGI